MSGRLVMDDLEHDEDFSPTRAYGTAKLANILFTKELHARFHDLGVSAAAFHPGNVATGFATESDSLLRHITTNPVARALMSSPEKAAGQLVWLAETTPGIDWGPASTTRTASPRGAPASRPTTRGWPGSSGTDPRRCSPAPHRHVVPRTTASSVAPTGRPHMRGSRPALRGRPPVTGSTTWAASAHRSAAFSN